jgi:hypothetical protein
MLLTRFWLLILAFAAGAGLAVAVIATRLVDERSSLTARSELSRDRLELEMVLKLDARTRIDAIAPLAANGDIRTALREANARQAGTETPEALRTRLRTRLGELNTQLGEMAGDLLFGVDSRGVIIAQVGGTPPPANAGLGAFPLVQRALEGYVRDDVWAWNGELYRMAARPVVENGQYIGAIVHGKRIDDAFASRVVGRLSGASLAFFLREQIVGSAMPDNVQGAPRRDDMAAPLPSLLTGALFSSGQVGDASPLPTGGFAIYAPIVGSASFAQAGYALARPAEALASPVAFMELASIDDWRAALPLLGGVTLALFLLSMLLVYLERDRPLGRFRDASVKVGKREMDRYQVADFGGPLRIAASSVNEALDRMQEHAGQAKKKVADLDSILGEAPSAAPSFFGFGGDAAKEASADAIPSSVPNNPPTKPVVPLPAAAPPPRPAPPPPAPAAAPPAPPPPVPPKPPAPTSPAGGLNSTMAGLGVSGAAVGAPVQASSGLTGMRPQFSPIDDEEEGATQVARVPEELIKQSATGQFSALSTGNADEVHFKDVFKQFVATKQQCGEATEGLTYEKFRETLRKNQEKIQQSHGTARVRFTVYVKEGKAALKATPVK